jgi:hypothetical protein
MQDMTSVYRASAVKEGHVGFNGITIDIIVTATSAITVFTVYFMRKLPLVLVSLNVLSNSTAHSFVVYEGESLLARPTTCRTLDVLIPGHPLIFENVVVHKFVTFVRKISVMTNEIIIPLDGN